MDTTQCLELLHATPVQFPECINTEKAACRTPWISATNGRPEAYRLRPEQSEKISLWSVHEVLSYCTRRKYNSTDGSPLRRLYSQNSMITRVQILFTRPTLPTTVPQNISVVTHYETR